jgi:hypothetical protein
MLRESGGPGTPRRCGFGERELRGATAVRDATLFGDRVMKTLAAFIAIAALAAASTPADAKAA